MSLIVESTCSKTAARGLSWVRFRAERRVDDSAFFVFSDGSSTGSFAAVVAKGSVEPTVIDGFAEPTTTRNVGAELNGARLGLQQVPDDSTVVLVFDYIGVGAWLTGNWKIKDPEVAEKIADMKRIIATKRLQISYVHHRGHQKVASEDDHFSRLNGAADARCVAVAKARPKKDE